MKDRPLLAIAKYHLSESKARDGVIQTLTRQGLTPPNGAWHTALLQLTKDRSKSRTFTDLVKEMRLTGVIRDVQRLQDHNDPIFGGVWSTATDSSAIELGISQFGFNYRAKGPGRIYPVEEDLMNDILYFREQVVYYSDEADFERTTRYFRNYLFACVAIVDAFLNKHIFAAEFEEPEGQELALLRINYRFEDKLIKWMDLFVGQDSSGQVTTSSQWSNFTKIKTARNDTIHVTQPYVPYAIKDFAPRLNDVKEGVGGLMKLLRDLQGRPSLSFIERLRTAPTVTYNG